MLGPTLINVWIPENITIKEIQIYLLISRFKNTAKKYTFNKITAVIKKYQNYRKIEQRKTSPEFLWYI